MPGRMTETKKNERGQTIILVAIAMLSLLAMAALAIDVVTLYVARSEAQRTATAAALAGAKIFATSGYTSVAVGGVAPSWSGEACTAAVAQAQAQVQATPALNLVAGQAPTVTVTCDDVATPLNPHVSVVVNRSGLPTFFARIWGRSSNSISATATAEAYNPSGQNAPISVSVKPWLLPNCDASNSSPPNPNCAGSAYFVNPADGSIANNGSFIGTTVVLTRVVNTGIPAVNRYYTMTIPITTLMAACPSTGTPSCGLVGTDDYLDNIACSNPSKISCGEVIGPSGINLDNAGGYNNRTNLGTQCLTHASNPDLGQGQDILALPNGAGKPVEITGGDNNPNPALQGVNNISRSDSIVTVPLYSGIRLCTNAVCAVDTTVVGFLQLGITRRMPGAPNGRIEGIILNASGCNPGAGGNAVSGGGVSPVPVRLINQ